MEDKIIAAVLNVTLYTVSHMSNPTMHMYEEELIRVRKLTNLSKYLKRLGVNEETISDSIKQANKHLTKER